MIEDWPSAWEMGRGAEVAVDAAQGVSSKGAEVVLAAGEALAVRLESAERFVAVTRAVIVHGGDRAYYQPAEGRIQLPPPEQFRSSEGYGRWASFRQRRSWRVCAGRSGSSGCWP